LCLCCSVLLLLFYKAPYTSYRDAGVGVRIKTAVKRIFCTYVLELNQQMHSKMSRAAYENDSNDSDTSLVSLRTVSSAVDCVGQVAAC